MTNSRRQGHSAGCKQRGALDSRSQERQFRTRSQQRLTVVVLVSQHEHRAVVYTNYSKPQADRIGTAKSILLIDQLSTFLGARRFSTAQTVIGVSIRSKKHISPAHVSRWPPRRNRVCATRTGRWRALGAARVSSST